MIVGSQPISLGSCLRISADCYGRQLVEAIMRVIAADVEEAPHVRTDDLRDGGIPAGVDQEDVEPLHIRARGPVRRFAPGRGSRWGEVPSASLDDSCHATWRWPPLERSDDSVAPIPRRGRDERGSIGSISRVAVDSRRQVDGLKRGSMGAGFCRGSAVVRDARPVPARWHRPGGSPDGAGARPRAARPCGAGARRWPARPGRRRCW